MSTVTSTPGRLLRLACASDLAAVREVARSVRSFLQREGLQEAELNAWELICAEAGNNAVEHAHGAAIRTPIEFSVELDAAMVVLRVTDHTEGFELAEHSELPELDQEGGRGIFLIRALSDTVQYLRGREENSLVVRRQRASDGVAGTRQETSIEQAMLESTLQTMTEELATSYEILSAIFRFTEELIRSGGEIGFAERWLRELRQITSADWSVLRLIDEARPGVAVARISHPELVLAPLSLDGPEPQASVEKLAVQRRQDVWFDAAEPPSTADPLSRIGASISGLSHPLFVAGELVGVLSIGRYTRTHPFTAGQVNIIHTLSDFLGIQVRNAQFQRATLQTQLLERDYEVASRIQRQLLPKSHPRKGRWATMGFCESAQRVGGDFYDIIEVGAHGLLLAVADVMGKGLPAALFATVFRTLLRARPELARSPGAFVDWLNQNLVTELGELDMFITAQLAYVNLSTRELRVAGAGHPPLLIAGRDQPAEQVFSLGPPLGIASELEFQEERRILPAATRLLLYTDGVSEATDANGTQVGTGPLLEILANSAANNHGAEDTLACFSALQREVAAGRPASDDRTILLLLEEDGLTSEDE